MYSLSDAKLSDVISFITEIFASIARTLSISSFLSQWEGLSISTHFGIWNSTWLTGNEARSFSIIFCTSSIRSWLQLSAVACTWYLLLMFLTVSCASSLNGFDEFTITINGLPIALSSCIVLSSGSIYASLAISPKLPSVVTTIPIVEWSCITLRVPSSAACVNGIGLSDHGVITILSPSPSSSPPAPFTIYPTQSISLTFTWLSP